MSFASFFAGLTGLQTNSSRLSIVGNNLANLNTIGFKSSRGTFMDIFSAAGGVQFNGAGNPMQVGRGTQFSGIDQIFAQGSLQNTNMLTDLSIQGKGFFVMASPDGSPSYTRAGNFSFDQDGNLVNSGGLAVQGFTGRDAQGNIIASGALGTINIPSGLSAPPQMTEAFNIYMNLDGGARVDNPATAGVNEAETFITTLTVFDSIGGQHNINFTFTPVDTDADGYLDEWQYDATVPGDEVTGGTPGTPYSIGTGTMAFDTNGAMTTPAGNITLNVPGWNTGAGAQTINWELYDDNGDPVISQWDGVSAVSSVAQDGFGLGALRTLVINDEGLISGIFTNGATQQLARLAMANFNNPGGLLRAGNNEFLATNTSGPPTVGAAASGGRGIVTPNSLELSNVDITEQFTDMIISQRGYQASSRIISTTDEVVQEALALKR